MGAVMSPFAANALVVGRRAPPRIGEFRLRATTFVRQRVACIDLAANMPVPSMVPVVGHTVSIMR